MNLVRESDAILGDPPPLDHAHQENHNRDDQEDVDEPSHRVGGDEPKQPGDDEDKR